MTSHHTPSALVEARRKLIGRIEIYGISCAAGRTVSADKQRRELTQLVDDLITEAQLAARKLLDEPPKV